MRFFEIFKTISFISIFIFFITSCSADMIANMSTVPDAQLALNNMITIEGIAEDENSKPISDVTIIVKDNYKELTKTKTDQDGKFSVKVPKTFDESYFVEAKKEISGGFLYQTLLINAGETANFTGNNSLKKNSVAEKPVPIA